MKFTIGIVGMLMGMVEDFKGCAERAEGGIVLVPGTLTYRELIEMAKNIRELTSTGDNESEPCYASLEEGLAGHNGDGSEHHGFIVVDSKLGEIMDVIDRNGTSILENAGLECVSGHDMGVPIAGIVGDIQVLSQYMGKWVVPVGARFSSTHSCRCPLLDVDVFDTEEQANEAAKNKRNFNGEVKQITPEFIAEYRELRKNPPEPTR